MIDTLLTTQGILFYFLLQQPSLVNTREKYNKGKRTANRAQSECVNKDYYLEKKLVQFECALEMLRHKNVYSTRNQDDISVLNKI